MHVKAESMFIIDDEICICYGGDDRRFFTNKKPTFYIMLWER